MSSLITLSLNIEKKQVILIRYVPLIRVFKKYFSMISKNKKETKMNLMNYLINQTDTNVVFHS